MAEEVEMKVKWNFLYIVTSAQNKLHIRTELGYGNVKAYFEMYSALTVTLMVADCQNCSLPS